MGTVDRVLHNRGEVSETTRKRILGIIKELNYEPNVLASTLASKKNVVFATLLPHPASSETYWNKPFIGVQKRVAELKQYGILTNSFTFSQAEPSSFSHSASQILELKPDGVVFAPFFRKESFNFIDELKKKGIPFVFIDSEIEYAGQIGYIGQDSYQSGKVAARLLHSLIPNGNILIVHFAKEMDNQNHLAQRENGFYNWLNENNISNTIITSEIPDTENDNWMEHVSQLIRLKNISGIFVTNSKVYLVGNLIEKYNLEGLHVIGHDLLKWNVEYLKKGVVSYLICQRPEEQGYNAVNLVFRHVVQKRVVQNTHYTPIDIVIKENVDYYREFSKS